MEVVDLVASFLVELFNRSLAPGHFPAAFREAFVIQIVMKPGDNATDIDSYRLISNIMILSKLL
jgi:hypothetical protein